MAPADVETLEHATLAAVPPQRIDTLAGWLLALDDGTVGRAHSAVPTRHDGPDAAAVPRIVERYRAAGLAPVLRVPQLPAFAGVHGSLQALGFAGAKPTLTQVGEAAGLLALPAAHAVDIDDVPGDDWASVFLGPGFDGADGASRLAILRRSQASVYASVRIEGQVVAVGSACFAHGWCGVHGMRTAPAWRGRGCAGAILQAFGRLAQARGVGRCFLQVEQANAPAQALYARAGLRTAWVSAYWAVR